MTKDAKAEGTAAVLAAIEAMAEPDRTTARRLHEIVITTAPTLTPRTWYNMPAYGNDTGKVIIYFRERQKFGERYLTFGFNDTARLDDGTLWPIAYALTDLTTEAERTIAVLVKKAAAQ